MLAAAGTSWFGLEQIPSEWYDTARAASFVDELVAAVQQDYDETSPFVLKDPRICRLMPVWRTVSARVGARMHFAHIIRNPLEVAHSLSRRNGLPLAYGCLLWLAHVTEAEYATRGEPRVFKSFDELLRDPARTTADILAQLAIDGLAASGGSAGDLASFIDPEGRHHKAKICDLGHQLAFYPWLASTYQSLTNLIRSPTDTAAQRSLDSVRAYLQPALASFVPLFASHDQSLTDLQARAAILDEILVRQINQVDPSAWVPPAPVDQIAHLGNVVAEREETIVQLEGRLAKKDDDLERIHDVIAEGERKVHALEGTISRLYASTSWRITAPLRFGKRLQSRLRFSAAGYPLMLGWRVLTTRSLAPVRDWRAARIIAGSELFDRDWYLTTNPDVAAFGLDPIRHFVEYGAREGRDPSPSFSTSQYFASNPDVAVAGMNPLAHFILYGAAEGRTSATPIGPLVWHNGSSGRGRDLASKVSDDFQLFRSATRHAGGIVPLAQKGWRILSDEGFGGAGRRLEAFQRTQMPRLDGTNSARQDDPISPAFFGIDPVAIPDALANAQAWCTDASPQVSIAIINWNAAQLTLECVRQIWANTKDVSYEIIIVDNGSNPQSIMPLKTLGSGTRLLELGENRYFGEANNIAAEQATGKNLCFLNNDAFVRPGWLRSLVEELDNTPAAGAVGPKFLFPDRTLQEAGCIIDENGYPTRLGRHLDPARPEFNAPRFVDYVSAAAMLIEKQLFVKAGGFDLAYEPSYYEDCDLCFKLLAMGRPTRFCPAATVIHIEGASANNSEAAQGRRKALGDLNRDKFVGRWGSYLKGRSDQTLLQLCKQLRFIQEQPENSSALPVVKPQSAPGSVAIFTPFALTPGGGERYILTLAAALAKDKQVTVVTVHPYSHIRLLSLGREFDVDLSRCNLLTYKSFVGGPRPDFMFTLGNNIVPPVPACAADSWYQCQFPFTMSATDFERRRDMLAGYRGINVYSSYTKEHVLRALKEYNLTSMPVEVIYPPVPRIAGDVKLKKNIIVTVGRFFVGGHSKRQDLMIAAFRDVIKKFGDEVEFHLAGSSIPESPHLAYLHELKEMARELPVKFHVNPTTQALWDLYRDAALYWHATGLQCDMKREPEKAEHFGISIVEAMSAECVPLAFNAGGPREIISHGADGYLYDTTDELVDLTIGLLRKDGAARRIEIGRAASKAAARYSVERFASEVRRLVETTDEHN